MAKRCWTAVASTGAVDEESLYTRRFAFTDASLGYFPGTQDSQPVQARYNVVNIYERDQDPSTPGWNTLELGSTAPPGSQVTATLYRVAPCTGDQEAICTVTNQDRGRPSCVTDRFPEGAVDFANFLYYVLVELSRRTQQSQPVAHTLRIYRVDQ
jgi:hypothetical protein